MTAETVRVGQPWLGEDERRLVPDAMERGEIGRFAAYVRESGERFADFCDTRFSVATSSGTGDAARSTRGVRRRPWTRRHHPRYHNDRDSRRSLVLRRTADRR
jgi:hypothetical protein